MVFDLDGVLCRYRLDARLEYLSRLSGREAAEIREAIWGSGFEDQADAGELSAEAYLAGFGARMGMALTREQWVAARRAAMDPDPAMFALARRLGARLPVALLTNNGFLLRETLPELVPELPPLFGERLFVAADLGARKPELAAYQRVAARLALPPGGLLMVDDNAANAAGAVAAGWQGHQFMGMKGLLARLAELGITVGGPE